MQQTKRYLLSTRPLSRAVVEEAEKHNITIEELSFIETKPVLEEEVLRTIKSLAEEARTVVFTSMNAVDAVADQVADTPGWEVYCIGNTTQKRVGERLPSARIVGTGENAERLAERLVDNGVKNAVFFCGNRRRDELPNKIRSEGGTVEEVIVYETTDQPSTLQREYDGILFFSPSAVNSFFKSNKAPKHTELFAIGKTTAEAIRQYANRKIIVANVTGKEDLVDHAIAFFDRPAPSPAS
jgi:uroporphyrinogen-III synthase